MIGGIKYVIFVFVDIIEDFMVNIEKVCVDKWLWSVWIFKLCIQVIDVCKLGKVQVNNLVVKFF